MGTWACALLLAGALGSCAPAVTQEALSTPYQVAVGAYYALLAGELDAAAARTAAAEALGAEPNDDAIRMVLAHVELYDYVRSGSLAARERLIGQLIAVDASLRSGVSAADWVEARLYVTFGDLLMHDARRDRGQWLDATAATVESLWRALLRIEAADAAYRYGGALGEGEPSPGLTREREHARTAQLASRLALVATIADLTTPPVAALDRLRRSALEYFEVALVAEADGVPATQRPSRVTVALDPDAHVLGAAAFEALATDAFEQLRSVCRDTTDPAARSAALDRYVDRLWRAGHHAVLADTLGVPYDAGFLLSLLEDAATREPERACGLISQ